METRARYVLVGLSSLLAVAIAFGMLMFSLNRGDRDKMAYYAIEFSGGVAGLSVGNTVRFNGIKMGEVRRITIDQNDASQVRVVIAVPSDTPIRQDSEASLSMQGITGLAVVDVTGGSSGSPRLPVGNNEHMSTIRSRRSTLGSVMEEAPNILHQANDVLTRASNLLSEENQTHINDILRGLASVAVSLERQNSNLEAALENLSQASARLNKLLEKDIHESLGYFNNSMKRINELVTELEPGAKRLTGGTADELMRVLNEAYEAARNINRLVETLNSDPQRFLFGDNIPGKPLR